jgi:hypothetical protein
VGDEPIAPQVKVTPATQVAKPGPVGGVAPPSR